MTTPWHASIFQRLRDGICFILWLSLALNCGIAAVYSVMFTYRWFQHAWEWASANWFNAPW